MRAADWPLSNREIEPLSFCSDVGVTVAVEITVVPKCQPLAMVPAGAMRCAPLSGRVPDRSLAVVVDPDEVALAVDRNRRCRKSASLYAGAEVGNDVGAAICRCPDRTLPLSLTQAMSALPFAVEIAGAAKCAIGEGGRRSDDWAPLIWPSSQIEGRSIVI